jgi:lipoyl(octanoyl) transferase
VQFPIPFHVSGPAIVQCGRIEYAAAYQAQCDHVEEVLASREAGTPEIGRILVVEHPPVITITRRRGAAGNLLASREFLASRGIAVHETDRGGDITYHGPGQLVLYPIVDLNLLNLGLHAYMRLLEEAVIESCARHGIPAHRDPGATGVWVPAASGGGPDAKICAMGVRVRKWISMHGLALNVDPDLGHFQFIVPCGLAGRPVTSIARECAARGLPAPSFEDIAGTLTAKLSARLLVAANAAAAARL